jgi:hypothetical protein
MKLEQYVATFKPEELKAIVSDFRGFKQYGFVHYTSTLRAAAETFAEKTLKNKNDWKQFTHEIGLLSTLRYVSILEDKAGTLTKLLDQKDNSEGGK